MKRLVAVLGSLRGRAQDSVAYHNTQNDANNIRSVWRDFNGDFGEDLLASQYRAHPHLAPEE